MPRLRVYLPLVVCFFLVAASQEAFSCPNCKEAISAQGDAEALKTGYSWSILIMLGMPMTMVSAGVFLFVRAAKKGLLPPM